MIPAALIIGYFWHEDHRSLVKERDLARKQHRDAEARACGLGLRLLLTTIERDNARAQLHPSGRLAPVAKVIDFPIGGAS